ncbi:MAG TPA: DNA polymerase III subunit beta [Ktedonobacterales bacterium]
MKITCKQSDMSRGLSVVSHAVATRSTLPVLSNILIATDENRLRLSATNLEIGITCWVPAQVAEEGSVTVPARLLTDFVGGLPQGTVEMNLPAGGYTLSVKSNRNAANVKGMDAGEFPTIPSADSNEPPVLLDAATLKEMIGQVAFAAATDEARPVFTGVLAQVAEDKITFAAADSYRLAVRSTDLTANGHPVGDILIPAKTLTELARILPAEGTVQMVITPNRSQVLFHSEGMDLISRLIDGAFPAYQRIMPQSHEMRAVLDTGEFRAAAKSVALFAKDSNNIVTLTIEQGRADGVEPGTAMLQATAEELGDNTSVVNAAVDGKGLRIMFNVRYLTDVLAVIDTPEVALELESAQKPGVVRPVGANDYTYVIMPMHTIR